MDRWIVTRLNRTLAVIDEAVASYQFNVYADAMYDLIWRDFCDWYLESIKPTVDQNPAQQQVVRTVLHAIVRMLHPICPFVTEALWPHIVAPGEPELLATSSWPQVAETGDDDEAIETVQRLQALTMAIRNLRGEHKVPPKKRVRLHAPSSTLELIDTGGSIVQTLAGLESVDVTADGVAVGGSIPLAFEGQQLFVSGMSEAVDVKAEQARLGRLCDDKEKAVAHYRAKLDNKAYVKKAPAHLVEETQARLDEAQADLAAARQAVELLEKD
jgi:valyl-tRNA synthetase